MRFYLQLFALIGANGDEKLSPIPVPVVPDFGKSKTGHLGNDIYFRKRVLKRMAQNGIDITDIKHFDQYGSSQGFEKKMTISNVNFPLFFEIFISKFLICQSSVLLKRVFSFFFRFFRLFFR